MNFFFSFIDMSELFFFLPETTIKRKIQERERFPVCIFQREEKSILRTNFFENVEFKQLTF